MPGAPRMNPDRGTLCKGRRFNDLTYKAAMGDQFGPAPDLRFVDFEDLKTILT